MSVNNLNITGLTDDFVLRSRAQFGKNELNFKKENGMLDALKSFAKEPMMICWFWHY
jgi:Ca2+-transporting ATPase